MFAFQLQTTMISILLKTSPITIASMFLSAMTAKHAT